MSRFWRKSSHCSKPSML